MNHATDEDKEETLVEFALGVYRADGVGAACLHLQDVFGVDVNVVLFATHVGAVRGEVLTPSTLEAAHGRVDAWHRDVVQPLRGVRKRLKTGPDPAPDESTAKLRAKIAKVEIEAELVELARLGEPGWISEAPAAVGSAEECAAAAIRVVVEGYGDRPIAAADGDAIRTIAAAAVRRANAIPGR